MGKFRRQLDFEPEVRASLFPRQDGRRAIDVALDKVPAEMRAGGKGELQIYATLGLQVPEIRPLQRFLQNIERQLVAIAERNGEAATVDRDAVAEAYRSGQRRCRDLKPITVTLRPQADDYTDFFD
jgi:hypothetical protein